MILAIKTDVPQAEIYLLDGPNVIAEQKWQAHRQLSETIHTTIKEMLIRASADMSNLSGVIFYEGPGSFTGLRIGCSVANAYATSYDVPIIATTGCDWLANGLQLLQSGKVTTTVEPNYGSDPHITKSHVTPTKT